MNTVITDAAAAGLNNAAAGSGASPLGKDEFLKLLVTQLQYQDPLEPMDNTEFVAQLAQFSALEGITNMGTGLGTISNYMLSMNNYNATGLIGKEVKAYGDEISFDGNRSIDMSYNLHGGAAGVTVSIFDGKGNAVRTLEAANQHAGMNTITWDGRDINGSLLPAGAYTFTVSAKDSSGSTISADTIMKGVVSGVIYENGAPYLMVNSSKISMNNVLEVWGQ